MKLPSAESVATAERLARPPNVLTPKDTWKANACKSTRPPTNRLGIAEAVACAERFAEPSTVGLTVIEATVDYEAVPLTKFNASTETLPVTNKSALACLTMVAVAEISPSENTMRPATPH